MRSRLSSPTAEAAKGGEMIGKDAHFLHEQRALEAVLVAPVDVPRAMSWVGTKELLLVATAEGVIAAVEPAFGTRRLFTAVVEPVHISTFGGDVLVFARDGTLQRWSLASNERIWSFQTGLVGNQGVRVSPTEIACIGEDAAAHREVVVIDLEGSERERLPVPPRTALGVGDDANFLLARSTEAGLRIVPLGQSLGDETPSTAHSLRFSPAGGVVGVASGGVVVWPSAGGSPRSVRLPDAVNAALHADGRTLALGTRDGNVAIADIESPAASRSKPAKVHAHEGPVRMLSFARKGRWLASIGDRCRVWAY